VISSFPESIFRHAKKKVVTWEARSVVGKEAKEMKTSEGRRRK